MKPVAWMDKETGQVSRVACYDIPLYTAPPTIQTRVKYGNPDTLETGWITIETPAPRKLSDEEIIESMKDYDLSPAEAGVYILFVRDCLKKASDK